MIDEQYDTDNMMFCGERSNHGKLAGGRWVVKNPKPQPVFYGLPAKVKLINSSAFDVSKRLDEYLRMNSIQASFDTKNAEASCKTASGCSFKIYLYQGKDNNNTNIEVVKMAGDGYSFAREKVNIINAAQNDFGKSHQISYRASLNNKTMKIPSKMLNSYVPPSEDELESILDRASDQLHSHNRDRALFSLQNLVSMTTPDKAYPQSAHLMSRLIMRNQVRDMIVAHYAGLLSISPNLLDETTNKMSTACLQILMNVVKASVCDDDHYQGQADDKFFLAQFVPSLVEAMKNYRDTHHAYLAMAMICDLMEYSPETRTILRGMANIDTILEEIKQYGSVEHSKLERTAKTLQSQLLTA